MATGTTTNLEESRTTIMTDALLLLGVIDSSETIQAADSQLCARFLNRLLKQWQAKGIHVWTNSYATLFLDPSVSAYTLGNETLGAAHWAETTVDTDLTADAAAAATTLTVTSTTGMTVGDHIGIVDDDNDIHWTTIATIPTSTTLTITSGLTAASADGNYVFTYTTRPVSGAPLRILEANRMENIGEQESQVMLPLLSFSDYFMLSNKKSEGTPVNAQYEKETTQGVFTLWPTPDNANTRIRMRYTRPIFNFDSNTDVGDISPEWEQALVYNLAVVLAPAYGALSLLPALKPMADEMLSDANDYDQEPLSLYVCGPTKERW